MSKEKLRKHLDKEAAAIRSVDIGQHWRIKSGLDVSKARIDSWPDEVVIVETSAFGRYFYSRVLIPERGKGELFPFGAAALLQHYELVYDPNRSEAVPDEDFAKIRKRIENEMVGLCAPSELFGIALVRGLLQQFVDDHHCQHGSGKFWECGDVEDTRIIHFHYETRNRDGIRVAGKFTLDLRWFDNQTLQREES